MAISCDPVELMAAARCFACGVGGSSDQALALSVYLTEEFAAGGFTPVVEPRITDDGTQRIDDDGNVRVVMP